MNCPRCGRPSLAVQRSNFLSPPMGFCIRCGHRWMTRGSGGSFDLVRETKSILAFQLIYIRHAIVAWLLISPLYYAVLVRAPYRLILNNPRVLLELLLMAIGVGVCLCSVLQ